MTEVVMGQQVLVRAQVMGTRREAHEAFMEVGRLDRIEVMAPPAEVKVSWIAVDGMVKYAWVPAELVVPSDAAGRLV